MTHAAGGQASCPSFTRAGTAACAQRERHGPVPAQPGGASPAPRARACAEERSEAPAPVPRAGERHAWHESSSPSAEESCCAACRGCRARLLCRGSVGVWHCTRCDFRAFIPSWEICRPLGERKSGPEGLSRGQGSHPAARGCHGGSARLSQPCPRALPARCPRAPPPLRSPHARRHPRGPAEPRACVTMAQPRPRRRAHA